VDGIVASATFDNVALGEAIESPTWQNRDIGAVSAVGRRIPSSDPSSISLEGDGADIWGTADAFHYEYRQWFGDGVITARVVGLENTNAWAKAGVMFRESLAANSKHVFALVSAARGMAVQSRSTTGGTSASTTPRTGTPPKWIRLERVGNTFTAHTTSDGTMWTLLGSVTVALNQDIFVGVAVTSHAAGTLATATFDDIFVEF
jgi:regulation of enolase protein 1 (concanavalin A-like superfamily)